MKVGQKYNPTLSIFEDSYTGRLLHSIRLYNPINLIYTEDQLMQMKKELDEYMKTGFSTRSEAELWRIHYILESNLHPETGTPVPKLFRWSAYCPVNIPIIIGIAVLPPTPLNQFIFQTVNQSYNFGINICNSTSSNARPKQEIAMSYMLAVSCALFGSIGLRKYLERKKFASAAGKLLLASTPFLGMVMANSVNMLFSRLGELKQGLALRHPQTGETLPDVRSKVACRHALAEGLLLRFLIPLPTFLVPVLASKYAARNFRFYQRTSGKLLFDSAVAFGTIWSSLVFCMSFYNPVGRLRLKQLEPHVRERLPPADPESFIFFNKGI